MHGFLREKSRIYRRSHVSPYSIPPGHQFGGSRGSTVHQFADPYKCEPVNISAPLAVFRLKVHI
jgi:hypothetical protein